MGFEFLHRLGRVVDQSKAGALATTIVSPEAEDGDVFFLGLVEFAELATEFVLGDVCAVGVEDVAAYRVSERCPSFSLLDSNLV